VKKRKNLKFDKDFIISHLEAWEGAIIYRSLHHLFGTEIFLHDLTIRMPLIKAMVANKHSLIQTCSGLHWVECDIIRLYNVIAFKGDVKKVFSSDLNYRSCAIEAGTDWDKIELVIQPDTEMCYRDSL
jgi:hypothetical protein